LFKLTSNCNLVFSWPGLYQQYTSTGGFYLSEYKVGLVFH
jgi:hypothetical protein